jgi:hypothetical protein
MAPLVSLTTPRSEVFVVWAEARVAMERMQHSIHPDRDVFTATPPEKMLKRACGVCATVSRFFSCPGIRQGLSKMELAS